jgi:hypothetical protein
VPSIYMLVARDHRKDPGREIEPHKAELKNGN